jgi:hypothetical protein
VVTSPYARLQREIAEEANKPFTPDQAPLFRAVLLHQETHYPQTLGLYRRLALGFGDSGMTNL